jgi:hypothetical protein
MKSTNKIYIALIVVIVLIATQSIVSYKLRNDLLINTEQIKNIEIPLQLSVHNILSYDSMLTAQVESALIHAQKGIYNSIPYHLAKYNEYEIKLDNLVRTEVETLLRQSKIGKEKIDKIVELLKTRLITKTLRVDVERKTFAAIENKDLNTAYNLLASDTYDLYKETLYSNWQNIVSELPIDTLSQNAKNKSQQDIYINILISLLNGIIVYIIFKTRKI